MRQGRVVARALAFCAVTLAAIVLAPVIVLVGEPVRKHYLRRLSRRAHSARVRGLARVFITNPVLIALTAPGRWVTDRLRRRSAASGGRDWPPSAGVREPRRPRPTAPVGAIALAEPRQRQRAIPIRKGRPVALSEPVRSRLPKAISRRLLRRPPPI